MTFFANGEYLAGSSEDWRGGQQRLASSLSLDSGGKYGTPDNRRALKFAVQQALACDPNLEFLYTATDHINEGRIYANLIKCSCRLQDIQGSVICILAI